ncbi:MAG: 3'(2'),5'-bisphosphate nucleotidase CysQ [Gemmatimonadota bacterium]
MTDLTNELSFASYLARRAGAAAMEHYGKVSAAIKEGGSPVTEADHAANRVIVEGLRRSFPRDAILSEESADTQERLTARRVWIVDPLDGTKEFLSQNGEFAVMIGLAVRGEPVLGVVYLPDPDVLYRAASGAGAWVERGGEVRRLERASIAGATPRMVGSRSHSEPLLEEIREALGVTEVVPCGSVGVKCSRIADGVLDLYVHPVRYLKEWDTCAPEVVAREAGCSVSDCIGEPLRYNKGEPVQPDGILVQAPGCDPAVLDTVRSLVG